MSGLLAGLCCARRSSDMGAALSHPQEGACGAQTAPTTMAEVIRERKKKAGAGGATGGAGGLGTLRRRLAAAAARRARACRAAASGDRAASNGRCTEHARLMRSLVSAWRPAEVAALHEEYEALHALRDLATQAELARAPAPTLGADLAALYDDRWCGDAELVYKGSCFPVHRAVLAARCPYFRDLLNGYPSEGARVCVEGVPPHVGAAELDALLRALYAGEPARDDDAPPPRHRHHPVPPCYCTVSSEQCGSRGGGGRYQCVAGGMTYASRPCNVCSHQSGAGSIGDCCSMMRGGSRPSDLDILSSDQSSTGSLRGSACRSTTPRGTTCRRRPVLEPAALRRLAEEFGFQPDALHRDMRYLLDSGEFADCALVFSWEGQRVGGEYGFRPKMEIPCHRAVLCARSPFFRSVISRRGGASAEAGGRRAWLPPSTLRIAVDERVLPRRFARALLHAAYTDQVDLSLIARNTPASQPVASGGPQTAWGSRSNGGSKSGTGAGGSGNAGQLRTQSILEDAMELYEIGRFLEMAIVVQGCEDAIAEALSGDTLPAILRWSQAPHASEWVHRQALRYLREEFGSLCAAGGGAALAGLGARELAAALSSPFLQAAEASALRALLRWAEGALAARIQEREPNVVSQTAHSVARKGVRRRDLSDAELREVLAPLAPLLRLEHVLPPDCDVLQQAIRRGLVSMPPAQMVEGAGGAAAWLGRGPYRPPRLFLPYYEEIKALMEDQLVAECEVSRVRRARYHHHIPDTLYMVSSTVGTSEAVGGVAVGGGAGGAAGAAVEPRALTAMRARQRELRAAPASLRALALPLTHAPHVHAQINLRVVREFNYPDCVAELLAAEAGSGVSAATAPAGGVPGPERRLRGRATAQYRGGGGSGGGDGRERMGRYPGSELSSADELSGDEGCPPHCQCDHPPSREETDEGTARSRSSGSLQGRIFPNLELDVCSEAALALREVVAGPSAPYRPQPQLPALVLEGQLLHYAARYGVTSTLTARRTGSRDSPVRLSEAVPDVAMATASLGRLRLADADGNQHLLGDACGYGGAAFRAVFGGSRRATHAWRDWNGGGMQLDLGDGTPHAPRTRAARAAGVAGVAGPPASAPPPAGAPASAPPAPGPASAPPSARRVPRAPPVAEPQVAEAPPPPADEYVPQAMGSVGVSVHRRQSAQQQQQQQQQQQLQLDEQTRAAVDLSIIQAYSSAFQRSVSPSIGHPLLGAPSPRRRPHGGTPRDRSPARFL